MSETEDFPTPAEENGPQDNLTLDGPPSGLRRADENGNPIVDAMAGRASVFGFGFDPIAEAIQAASESYLGDGSAFDGAASGAESLLRTELTEMLGESSGILADSMFLCSSAETAVESAIHLARKRRPGKAFRTITALGSDHGRTLACRTASGRPELHEGLGPMVAGFNHVPPGDLDAVRAVVDEQTACILVSPLELHNAMRPCQADYLVGLRAICDEHDMLLMIDESQIAFGSSGRPLAFSAIAEITADVVILSSGLFAGLAGGIVMASQRAVDHSVNDVSRYPLQAVVASETIASMSKQGLPQSASEAMHDLAVALAGALRDHEFVRDVNVLGMTIGIEMDIESHEVVRAAGQRGLRIEMAGDTAVRIQPPLIMSDHDRQGLLKRLGETMEVIERETASLST